MIRRTKPPYQGTQVSAEKTKFQISELLKKYGVEGQRWTEYHSETVLEFILSVEVQGTQKEITIKVQPPQILEERRLWNKNTGRTEKMKVQNEAVSMRLLFHWLKSKLEAVSWGLVSAEKEFLSNIMMRLPEGETTVGERLESMIHEGNLEKNLLPAPKREEKVIDAEVSGERVG